MKRFLPALMFVTACQTAAPDCPKCAEPAPAPVCPVAADPVVCPAPTVCPDAPAPVAPAMKKPAKKAKK